MQDEKKIYRAFGLNANLRAVDDESRTIEGYAIVFNERSKLVEDWNLWKAVIEVISPDAVSEDLLRTSDVIANINHNNGRMLARSRQGEGSLKLEKDEHGVKFSFSAPDTPDGQTAYEGVKRGDFYGCSFCYANDDDEVNVTYTKETDPDSGDDTIIRTVNKIDHLYDVSIVLVPAYDATSVEARGLEKEAIEGAIRRALPEYGAPAKKQERSKAMMADYDELNEFLNS